MFEATLFLGLLLSGDQLAKINGLDSQIKALFIDSDPDSIYLQELSLPRGHFLGKYAGHTSELAQLHQLQANIYSLLEKVLSDCRETPLVLISVKIPTLTN